ncbi:MAG: flagellar basal body rod protein FlgB [Pseudomonadota bacterium]|nr:flagellar basal body rod protein FlgB [Pseudomonadota bacterium]
MKPSLMNSMNNRMEYLIRRQGVVSENVANAETPNYLARDLDFKASVNKATLQMQNTNSKHIPGSGDRFKTAMTESKEHMRYDGNSVKLDEEMYKLNEIQLQHRMMTNLLTKHMGFQRAVVNRQR